MGGQSFTITSIPVAAAGTIPPFQSNGNLTRSFNVSFGGTIVPISDSGSYHSIRIALSRRIYLRSERSGILVPVEGGKELNACPIQTKPYSMPVHDGSGSNQDERFPRPRPERSQRNPEQLVQGSQSSARRKGKSNRESRQYRAKNFSWPVPPALAFTPRGMFPKVAWMLSGL
jgi:hypothetical protein